MKKRRCPLLDMPLELKKVSVLHPQLGRQEPPEMHCSLLYSLEEITLVKFRLPPDDPNQKASLFKKKLTSLPSVKVQ
jgi:hypothetical protein